VSRVEQETGCFLIWGILLALAAAKTKNGTFHKVLLVFGWLDHLLRVGNDRRVRVCAS
jgi:hypothetical protein